ncbi:hypothetical protein, partial [Lactococcus petauri]|uniref:hypothetical protein n=1 Tax=Lactococcus petauri TaxID=1940789 RepID=UPI0021F1FC16
MIVPEVLIVRLFLNVPVLLAHVIVPVPSSTMFVVPVTTPLLSVVVSEPPALIVNPLIVVVAFDEPIERVPSTFQ